MKSHQEMKPKSHTLMYITMSNLNELIDFIQGVTSWPNIVSEPALFLASLPL